MNPMRIARSLVEAQTRRPWSFVLTVLAVTVLAGAAAAGLDFDSRYEALLPEDSAELAETERVRAETGGTRQVVLAIGGAEAQARLEFGRRLVPRLREIEEVRFVDLEFPVDFFEDRAPG
jgi:predicted RND superfamily exporter protein